MSRLRIGWLSFHREGLDALEALVDAGTTVVAVVTLDPERRAERSGAVDYAPICDRHGIALHEIRNVNDDDSLVLLTELDLDVLFVIGWAQILGARALSAPRLGCYGAHASLLPHNRGSAPVNWAIIKGETETGNSLIRLEEGVDTGAVVDQARIPITPFDDCASVYAEVAALNTRMVIALVRALERGETPGTAQTPGDGMTLPRRRPHHGTIDWRWSASKTYDFIRALARPYPGAFGHLEGVRYVVRAAALLPIDGELASPGLVLGPASSPVNGACGQVVACGRGALVLLELVDDTGRSLSGRELAEATRAGVTWNIEANELDIYRQAADD